MIGWDIGRPAGVAPVGGASAIGYRDCGAAGLGMQVVAIPAITVVIEFAGNELTVDSNAGRHALNGFVVGFPRETLRIRIKQRCADGLSVMGLRFRGDRRSPAERFDFLRSQLGDGFIAIELDDADANPDGVLKAHSVLTEHLIDEPGQPTHAALHQVLDFLRGRLVPG